MKLSIDVRTDVNLIRSYASGEVRVGETIARAPLLVAAQALVLDWPARDVATLDAALLEPIFALAPEVVIIGVPAPVVWPPAAVRALLGTRRIGVEVMELGAACRTFNVLVQEGRRVVAALLP